MAKQRGRRICFVTGTRAEFGLMASTLRAIRSHPSLELQVVATGMHLDPAHGRTIDDIRRAGFVVDATVPWRASASRRAPLPFDKLRAGRVAAKRGSGDPKALLARQTGLAVAGLADVFVKLDPDVVLVVGDRVEAFAAATAAHLSGRVVAHVHGGDRALGQVDDALRHAVTKLAHVHFPATKQSAERVAKLGEDRWRIHRVGSPGIDGITGDAWPLAECDAFLGGMGNGTPLPVSSGERPDAVQLRRHRFALLLLHPTDADAAAEHGRADLLFRAALATRFEPVIVVYPNNDPGAAGIAARWDVEQFRKYRATPPQLARVLARRAFVKNLPRPAFLGLLRDAGVLVGNSSSGIIEAASFGTPVVDVGPRQAGREHGANVTSVPFNAAAVRKALRAVWNGGRPVRYPRRNIYGAGDTAARIARVLATVRIDERLRRKLIAY
jgi:UDP-hydrolysing UDP-N-acetyl-D-glucosamine 2-epimerase